MENSRAPTTVSNVTVPATQNSLWTGLNTTDKITDVGITTEELDRVTTATATTTNTLTTGANYLKLNNLPKINIEEKKEKTMFEGMLKNLRFGKADNAKMSIYGPAFLGDYYWKYLGCI